MELTQLVQRAQQALDRGEIHVVEAACRHALTTYPACLAAHRLLGEACLEQGRIEEAEERFGLALVLNPLDPVANFGMGVAAEERGDLAAAHAHHLRAWELNPELDQLRDEVVRLHTALHGDGRLVRSRAGLAGTFARSGQLHRAAAEWRAVVAAEPENLAARTALIEVLWRQNDDAAALALCREVLAIAPETARVLAIQADLEQRRALPTLSTTVATYRSLDPTGEILIALRAVKPQANIEWLLPEAAMAPPFDFEAAARTAAPAIAAVAAVEPAMAMAMATTVEATSAVGPAPDLWDSLVRDMGSNGGGQELAPFAWPMDNGGSAAPTAEAIPFDIAAVVGGSGSESFGETPPAATRTRAAEGDDRDPLAALGLAAPAAAARAPEQFVTADGRVDLTVGWDDLDRTLAEATPRGEAAGYDALIAEVGAAGIAPFDPLGDEAEWESFAADDFGDWDVEPATAADDTVGGGEPATPEPDRAADPGRPAASLGDDLVWPDDAGLAAVSAEDRVSSTAFTAGATAADAPPAGQDAELDAIQAATAGWDAIEEELTAAAPPLGGTIGSDGVESIDDEGLVPFDFSIPAQAVDPLANPDAVGSPLAFDDLLMVTSRDATAPLVATAAADGGPGRGWDDHGAEPSLPWSREVDRWTSDDERGPNAEATAANALPGIVPFAFEETALPPTNGAIDFSDVEDDAPAAVGEFDDFALFEDFSAAGDGGTAADAALPAGDWAAEFTALAEAEHEPFWAGAVVGEDAAVVETSDPPPAAGDAAAWAADAVADAPPAPAPAPSVWPAFMGGTSELVDPEGEVATIFARLRVEKAALVAQGLVRVDRSVGRVAPPAAVAATATSEAPTPRVVAWEADAAAAAPVALQAASVAPPPDSSLLAGDGAPAVVPRPRVPALSPEAIAEIARWRERLRSDEADAAAVVAEIEDRIAEVGEASAYQRLLAEAYLRLGRPDLAAVRLRAATVRRLARA